MTEAPRLPSLRSEQRASGAPLAYFWGDDADALRRATEGFARTLGGIDAPLDIWRVTAEGSTPAREPRDVMESVAGGGDQAQAADGASVAAADAGAGRGGRASLFDAIELRVGTAPLFGGGVLVIVVEPVALVRSAADRKRVERLLTLVAPGNGLAFTELTGNEPPGASTASLRAAVANAGGLVQRFQAPRGSQLASWIEQRAVESDARIERGAAALLAERIGGMLREGDIDRSRQTEVADAELRKLALYHPGGTISRDDVVALVTPAVPGSTWGFLDAVCERRIRDASTGAERLNADAVPLQVIVTQLHHRLRQLLQVNEARAAGSTAAQLVRTMRLKPFRAQKLWEQAGAWTARELSEAIQGLLEVDLASKQLTPNRDGAPLPAGLALELWLVEHVARR